MDRMINEEVQMNTKLKNEFNASQVLEELRLEKENQQKPIIKIYLAILNNGPLRSEMTATVIPQMQRTPGIKLIWENPDKTWANPISSNRNKIVKRFLATNCDYLLMIDDDVVPLHNPCELIYADKDIIGSPALVRSAGNIATWTAYIPHPNKIGYSAVDLDSVDDLFDIIEVAIVGTGCILIKRKVLENLKAPFHSEFDDDGIQTYGTDFAFCRKATQANYKVYTTVHRRCEHFKKVGFSDITAWDSINYCDRSNVIYNIPWGEKNISQKDWSFIKIFTDKIKPKRILEFGTGLSSFLLSEICEVVSYEIHQEYARLMNVKRLELGEKNNLHIELWNGHTISKDLQTHLNVAEAAKEKTFDLVFINGPDEKRIGGVGRDEVIRIASKISNNIIIRDAGMPEEIASQRKYLRGTFKLVRKSGNHLARCHYWERRPYFTTLEELKKQLLAKKDKEE